MFKRILLIAGYFLFSNTIWAQMHLFNDTLTLDYPLSSETSISAGYLSWIKLSDGFSYAASGDNSFSTVKYDFGNIDTANITGGPNDSTGLIVGTDGVVGAIPGSFSVSPTGAGLYSIPIECPQGINGMTPSLALVYNSQAGNGMAGYGWNLSGLSVITRSPKTYYTDNQVKEIVWDDTDQFALDGQRLELVYDHGDSIEYRIKDNPISKVMHYDYGIHPINLFKVWAGDGTVKTYSYHYVPTYKTTYYEKRESIDETNYVVLESSTNYEKYHYAWCLSKITDIHGNFIAYDYASETEQRTIIDLQIGPPYFEPGTIDNYYEYTTRNQINLRPYKIIYGNGSNDLYTLELMYLSRPDTISAYLSGASFKNYKILDKVKIHYGSSAGPTIKTYDLIHSDDSYSYLTAVELTGKDGAKYNKTVFEWDNNAHTLNQSSSYEFAIPDFGYYQEIELLDISTVDINGDKIYDFLCKYYTYTYFDTEPIFEEINYHYVLYLNPGYPTTLSQSYIHTTGSTEDYFSLTLDIDNDLKEEFYLGAETFPVDNEYFVKYPCLEYDSQSDALITNSSKDIIIEIESYDTDTEFVIVPGDYTGDGKIDFMLIKIDGENVDYYLKTDSTTIDLYGTFGYFRDINYLDFNGNGKMDIILRKVTGLNSHFEIWEFDGTGSFIKIHSQDIDIVARFVVGDFSGDGNGDLLIQYPSSWEMFLSNGKEFIPDQFAIEGTMLPSNADKLLVGDFNQDGKLDLVHKESTTLKLLISNGSKFNLKLNQTGLSSNSLNFVSNLNEDGNSDIFIMDDKKFYSISPEKSYNSLRTITNGLGNKIQLDYTIDHLQYGNFQKQGQPDLENINPYIFYKYSFKTISEITTDISKETYIYNNPIVHTEGQGFLGFGKVIKESTVGDFSTKSIQTFKLYEKDSGNTYDFLPDSTKSFINGNYIGYSKNNYTEITKNGIHYNVVSSSLQEDLLKNTSVITSIGNYNDYLKPCYSVTSNYQGGELVARDSSNITYTNILNYNLRIVGLPLTTVNIISRPGEETHTNHQEFNYYANGNLQFKYLEKGTNYEIKNEYTYDSFGNLIIEKLSADSLPDRETFYRYSSDGRFLVSKTGPLGFTDSLVYQPDLGLVIKKIDVDNNLETNYDYDGFGNLILTKHPGNNQTCQGLRWIDIGNELHNSGTLYYSFKQSLGAGIQYKDFDKFGKELRDISEEFNGETIIVDKIYDRQGRDSLISMPYFLNNGASGWTAFRYNDDYGWLKQVTSPDGRLTRYNYNGRVKTIETGKDTTDLQHTIQTVNALGETIISEDNDGKKVYTHYYSNGLPKEIVLNNGPEKVTLEYDFYGNRIKLTDPNAGEIATEYNSIGELIKLTDAKGNVSEYTYDIGGRILTESLGNNTKNYYYDLDFAGSLASVSQSNPGDSIVYDYDDLGNLIKSTEYFDGLQIENEYAYDFLGRMVKQTHPNSIEVFYNYNSFGILSSINSLGKTLWQCNDINEFGMVTSYKLGSRNSTINYDNTGLLTAQSYAGGTREFNYGFDNNMNLDYREDVDNQLKEDFAYDDMNRLLSAEYYVSGQQQFNTLEMQYDINGMGNIISKSGVSTDIQYGENAGPNALTAIVNPDPQYLPLPEVITYTDFNKLSTIRDTIENNQTIELSISYGLDDQRRKSTFIKPGTSNKVKYFFGEYEKIIDGSGQNVYLFVSSPTGLCAIIQSYDVSGETVNKVWHTYSDHLGSLVYIENADNENEFRHYSYDAWGNPRNHTNWLNDEPVYELLADRGFTGHEHLEEFRLINMNGRVYDPVIGRFLSPDPYVQMPGSVDGFNRYAYCLNNPLIYTDPNGEVFQALPLLLFMAGTAIMGGTFFGSDVHGNWSWENAWKGAAASMIVSGSLIASAYLPVIFTGPGILPGVLSSVTQFGMTALSTGASNWMGTGDFVPNWNTAFFSALPGLVQSIAGGIDAIKGRGNIFTGKGGIYECSLPIPTEEGGSFRFKNQNDFEVWLNSKVDINDFGVTNVDAFSEFHIVSGDNLYYRYSGRVFKINLNTLKGEMIGGFTQMTNRNIFSRTSAIYMGQSSNFRYFTAVLNHELIHAYHISMGLSLRPGFNNYTEFIASNYMVEAGYFSVNTLNKFIPRPYEAIMPPYLIPLP